MEYLSSIDFSYQLDLANYIPDIEACIINILSSFKNLGGSIVVIGDFGKNQPVKGMLQMKPKTNPVSKFLDVQSDNGKLFIKKYSLPPYDGAIVVNSTGQILGAGVYLEVLNPTLDIPDSCGTRHKAAASFSKREDVHSVITLSEESGVIRVWKDGAIAFFLDCEADKDDYENKEEEFK